MKLTSNQVSKGRGHLKLGIFLAENSADFGWAWADDSNDVSHLTVAQL